MIYGLLKALSFYWLFRALSRGPQATARYTVRRQLRRSANRVIRRI